MNSVQRTGVYAFYLSLSVFSSFNAQCAPESKDGSGASSTTVVATNNVNNHATESAGLSEFQWADHKVLSWDDFKGSANASSDMSAAATHCGIGFRTGKVSPDGKAGIIVYNTFYVNKSWVKPDARISTILTHEQGHFDLCEIYTRKLRQRMDGISLTTTNLKTVLENIYFDVKNEYERRQQAYEDETTHGTNFTQQSMWCEHIAHELATDNGALAYSTH